MVWTVELDPAVERDLGRLDPGQTRRILRFLHDRLAPLTDPRSIGAALQGARFGEFWKYRVGDYRIISRIEDAKVRILVIRIGHRSSVYRR